MKIYRHINQLLLLLTFGILCTVSAQENTSKTTELLTNADVVAMARSNLGAVLILDKIRDSKATFDTSVESLISLKKEGVADEIVAAMMEKSRALRSQTANAAENQPVLESVPAVVKNPADALRSARTIHIEKSTINPSRQALEKELLKRADWQKLNLNIVRYRDGADLRVEIGFVPLSLITHRYVFRIYDNRSGTVVAAGETTSWGSLAKNLAREMSKKLSGVL